MQMGEQLRCLVFMEERSRSRACRVCLRCIPDLDALRNTLRLMRTGKGAHTHTSMGTLVPSSPASQLPGSAESPSQEPLVQVCGAE